MNERRYSNYVAGCRGVFLISGKRPGTVTGTYQFKREEGIIWNNSKEGSIWIPVAKKS